MAAFLNEVMGLPLTAQGIVALEERTEGWLAGLQLAALAMRDQTNLLLTFREYNATFVCTIKQEIAKMQKEPPILLHHCLYFTANSLARAITRMTEEEFRMTGLSPSYAFLLMLVNTTPGISQKELARQLHLTPSTVTRFIDHLAQRGYLERRVQGKSSEIFPTEKGSQLQETIGLAWRRVYQRYSDLLGEAQGQQLTQMTDQASQLLNQ